MSKFIIITNSGGKKIAIRKDIITFVTENGTKEDPTRVWVKREYEDEPYGCCETFEAIMARLEE